MRDDCYCELIKMPSLNLEFDYLDHPKTKRLVLLLGKGAEILPLRLWSHVGKYHMADGKLAGYPVEQIEAIAMWWGKPGDCVRGLLEAWKVPEGKGFIELIPEDEGGGYLIHNWLQHAGHLAKYHEAAKAGARARWGDKGNADRNADRNASSVQSSSVQKESPPTPQGAKRGAAPYPAGFELFWLNYPRKVGKRAAFRAWAGAMKRSGKNPSNFTLMVQKAVAKQKRSAQWEKDDGQFIPHPSTWLNQDRWDDELRPAGGHTNNVPDGPPQPKVKINCKGKGCKKITTETFCSVKCRMGNVG